MYAEINSTPGQASALGTVAPITRIQQASLQTFEQAERAALLVVMRYLYQQGKLKYHEMVPILGVTRHAIKRRMEKHGLTLASAEVTSGGDGDGAVRSL